MVKKLIKYYFFLVIVSSFFLKELAFSNPDKVVVHNSTIYVYDPLENHAMTLYDTESFNEINRLHFGRGPAEIAGILNKTILPFKNNISIYDRSSGVLKLFDKDLNLKLYYSLEGTKKMPFQAAFMSDSVLFIVPNYGDFIQLYKVNMDIEKEEISCEEVPFFSMKINDNPQFKNLDNFLLRQDIHITNNNNTFYLSFEYSDLLLKINDQGLYTVNKLFKDYHYFPNTLDKDGYYNLPTIGEDPICSLDIDFLNDKIYVLRNGKKENGSIFKKMFKIDKLLKEADHGKECLVYNSSSLELEKVFILDNSFNSILAIDDNLWGLGSLNEVIFEEIIYQ